MMLPCAAQTYAPREMDLHLHSGMERPAGLDTWLDLAVKDGRKVVLLLDHLELYRKTPEEYDAWRTKGGFDARYPIGPQGHRALFTDFSRATATRNDLQVFRGWEIFEGELDTGLEEAPMRMADAIGWHISPRNGRDAPNGQTLLRRTRQLRELQKRFPIPMILLHPFAMRVENLQRAAKGATLTVADYRFFQPGEQQQLIDLLKGTSIYVEMNRDMEKYFDDPIVRKAWEADVIPLAKGGVQFTVSTDNHHLKAANKPFTPERFCEPLGVTRANSNRIVRELMDARAKRRIAVISHRGEHRSHPENTMPAFQAAVDAGSDFIEVDVRTTSDGKLVLMHDATVDRTTNGKGKLREMTLAKVSALDAGGAAKVPTFDEVLAFSRGKINVYVDTKDASAQALVDALERHQMQDKVVVYGSLAFLSQLAKLRPAIKVMPESVSVPVVKRIIDELKPNVIAFGAHDFTEEIISLARASNAAIYVDRLGDADKPEYWQDAIDRGADGIQSDRPAELVTYLRSRGYRQ